jgi:hypothetical protein
MTLVEFFAAVNAIDGKFHNDGQRVVLEAPGQTVSPTLLAAVEDHQAWLAATYPARTTAISDPRPGNNADEVSDEEFFAAIAPR